MLDGGGGASSERVADRGTVFSRANLHYPTHQGAFWHNLVYKCLCGFSMFFDLRLSRSKSAVLGPVSSNKRGTALIFVLVFGTMSGFGCHMLLAELESCKSENLHCTPICLTDD